jgi:dihydroxy-acid dehydratase
VFCSFERPEKRILLNVPDEVLEMRRTAWAPPPPAATRGYVSMYVKHVMGADKGADLDFLKGSSGSVVTRDSH